MMRYLTIEEILEINAEVMGGKHICGIAGYLNRLFIRPQASAFGTDAYPDLVSKAAALLHSLIMNHAFVYGNKRTAVLAALILTTRKHSCRVEYTQKNIRFSVNQINHTTVHPISAAML